MELGKGEFREYGKELEKNLPTYAAVANIKYQRFKTTGFYFPPIVYVQHGSAEGD